MRRVDGVRARRGGDGHGDTAIAAEIAADRVILRAEFDARHIAQESDLAFGGALDNDLAELLGRLQAPFNLYRKLIGHAAVERRRADRAAGRLDVLGAEGCDDLGGGKIAGCGLARINPDPHRVEAAAEYLNAADALDAEQAVFQ